MLVTVTALGYNPGCLFLFQVHAQPAWEVGKGTCKGEWAPQTGGQGHLQGGMVTSDRWARAPAGMSGKGICRGEWAPQTGGQVYLQGRVGTSEMDSQEGMYELSWTLALLEGHPRACCTPVSKSLRCAETGFGPRRIPYSSLKKAQYSKPKGPTPKLRLFPYFLMSIYFSKFSRTLIWNVYFPVVCLIYNNFEGAKNFLFMMACI